MHMLSVFCSVFYCLTLLKIPKWSIIFPIQARAFSHNSWKRPCIVLYCAIYNVALTECHIASWGCYVAIWERNVALFESNVINVVSTQRHINLLMICKTLKPVEEREKYV